MKNSRKQLWLFALLVLPVGKVTNDSSQTTLGFSAGTGQYAYVSRGCEGQVLNKKEIPFTEFNASVEHNATYHLNVGFRASYLATHQHHQVYTPNGEEQITVSNLRLLALNPALDFRWKYFAIGGGFLWASDELPETDNKYFPSAYLRVGNVRSIYLDAAFLQKTPLISDGYFTLGLGSSHSRNFGYWIGLGAGPYDRAGLVVKTNIGMGTNTCLNVLGRLWRSEGISEWAMGIGVSYRMKIRE